MITITITITNNLFRHMIKKNNIQRYTSRFNTIIVKEITLGHKYRCHGTTNVISLSALVYILRTVSNIDKGDFSICGHL